MATALDPQVEMVLREMPGAPRPQSNAEGLTGYDRTPLRAALEAA